MKIPKIDNVNKYLYVEGRVAYIRLLGLVGLLASLFVCYGMARYFSLSVWYWVVFGPIVLLVTFSRIVRYSLQIAYPKFDIKKHEKFISDFWGSTQISPSVDVFLPYAGESTEVFNLTLQGVKNLEYDNFKVYILDDSDNLEIANLATIYGFNHLSRPNKGEHRKSGNLQYGYDHSDGEFVLVLDADFIPARDALYNTIPYLATNPQVGILQTPQYFEQTHQLHKDSPIQYGGGNIVEDFYRIDMPGRDRFKAALCVGTSAIYRREAILRSGGTPKVNGTEDVRQGLLITQYGYFVKYLPLIISIGDSPDSMQGYFRQHNRWCSGSIETIFGEYFAKAKLSPAAKLIYLTNATYYITEALGLVFSFHLLTLLYFHYDSLSITNIVWFVPYLIYYYILLPLNRVHKQKFGTIIAAASNAHTYLYTIPNIPVKRVLPWIPAGVKQSKVHSSYNTTINLGLILSSAFLGLFSAVLIERPQILTNYNAYPTLIWAFYSAFWGSTFLYVATSFIKNKKMEEVNAHRWHKRIAHKALLHFKNYLSPILLVFVISVALIEADVLLSKHSENNNVIVKTTTINQTSESQGATPGLPNSYTILAKRGDSQWSLSRSVISKYAGASNKTISKTQLEQATYWLVLATQTKQQIKPGDRRVFATSDVKAAVERVSSNYQI